MDAPAAPAPATKPKAARPAPLKPAPGEEDVGVSTLPVSRVGKIIKADSEIFACSKEAVFLIGVATEFFLQKMTDAAFLQARQDQRKTVALKDVARAVRFTHELSFLRDIMPLTLPLQEALNEHARQQTRKLEPPLAATVDDKLGGEIEVAPRTAANKAYTEVELPDSQRIAIPTASIVGKGRSRTASASVSKGPKVPRPPKKPTSPRQGKDFSSFKKKERLPSLPDSLPTRARKSGGGPTVDYAEGPIDDDESFGGEDTPMEDVVDMA